jgi:hypothetical protein
VKEQYFEMDSEKLLCLAYNRNNFMRAFLSMVLRRVVLAQGERCNKRMEKIT